MNRLSRRPPLSSVAESKADRGQPHAGADLVPHGIAGLGAIAAGDDRAAAPRNRIDAGAKQGEAEAGNFRRGIIAGPAEKRIEAADHAGIGRGYTALRLPIADRIDRRDHGPAKARQRQPEQRQQAEFEHGEQRPGRNAAGQPVGVSFHCLQHYALMT